MKKTRNRTINKEHLLGFLAQFKSRNQERYDIVSMGIFGSAARGTNAEQSDVDVVSYREGMNLFLKKRIDAEAVYHPSLFRRHENQQKSCLFFRLLSQPLALLRKIARMNSNCFDKVKYIFDNIMLLWCFYSAQKK